MRKERRREKGNKDFKAYGAGRRGGRREMGRLGLFLESGVLLNRILNISSKIRVIVPSF